MMHRIRRAVGNALYTLALRVNPEIPTPSVLKPPALGMVAYEVEILPHDWANDGLGWAKGYGTPEEVASELEAYANQCRYFTSA